MLTEEQEKWINHLDDHKKVEFMPYNPKTRDVFEAIKKEILSFLPEAEVLHRGSTALQIGGQGEIDAYIPVLEKDFDQYLSKLIGYFGQPGSIYNNIRARFVKYIDSIKIEVFLINKETDDWKNLLKFENYLRENNDVLRNYEQLKMDNNGKSVREYYRKKLEFISSLVNKY